MPAPVFSTPNAAFGGGKGATAMDGFGRSKLAAAAARRMIGSASKAREAAWMKESSSCRPNVRIKRSSGARLPAPPPAAASVSDGALGSGERASWASSSAAVKSRMTRTSVTMVTERTVVVNGPLARSSPTMAMADEGDRPTATTAASMP